MMKRSALASMSDTGTPGLHLDVEDTGSGKEHGDGFRYARFLDFVVLICVLVLDVEAVERFKACEGALCRHGYLWLS